MLVTGEGSHSFYGDEGDAGGKLASVKQAGDEEDRRSCGGLRCNPASFHRVAVVWVGNMFQLFAIYFFYLLMKEPAVVTLLDSTNFKFTLASFASSCSSFE